MMPLSNSNKQSLMLDMLATLAPPDADQITISSKAAETLKFCCCYNILNESWLRNFFHFRLIKENVQRHIKALNLHMKAAKETYKKKQAEEKALQDEL